MIGRFARSGAGHDKGLLYVVIGTNDGQVILSEGRYKPVTKPKVKNLKHVEILDRYADEEVITAIKNQRPNVNEVIRRAIKREEKNV